MSEELKCPCCGWVNEANLYNSFACTQCLFMCTKHDFNRIAAAMELAKAEVAAFNAAFNVPLERLEAAIEASEDMLFQARMRVLEVFK